VEDEETATAAGVACVGADVGSSVGEGTSVGAAVGSLVGVETWDEVGAPVTGDEVG
jgi:F0F1-type ATP synthase membrane subunit c/vacuolar-type H+-ATPase subunit K